MIISPFTPLFFCGTISDGIESRYMQTFAKTDVILIECICGAQEDAPQVSLVCGGSTRNISTTAYVINDSVTLRYAELTGLDNGVYQVRIGDKTSREFRVTDNEAELAATTLIQYSMRNNCLTTEGVFVVDGVRKFFSLRVPGGFKDSDIAYGCDSEQFSMQNGDVCTLYSVDTVQVKFTMGSQIGVPACFGELLNRLLTCTYVYFNGVRHERKDSSTPEVNVQMEGLDSFVYKILLQRVSSLCPTLADGIADSVDDESIEDGEWGGGSGNLGNDGVDMAAVWAALAAGTNEKINKSHLPSDLGGGGGNGGGCNCDGHSHANKSVLDTIGSADGYIKMNGNKAKAGYADEAGDAGKWDGHEFDDYLDQDVKTDSDVTFASLEVTGGTTTNGITNTGEVKTDTLKVLDGSELGGTTKTTEIDNSGKIKTRDLEVTGTAHFYEAVIDRARATNGIQFQSVARAKIDIAECDSGFGTSNEIWSLYFLSEDDSGKAITNDFIVGDQVYCQVFNLREGTSNNVGTRYYWARVFAVSSNVSKNGLKYHKIRLRFSSTSTYCDSRCLCPREDGESIDDWNARKAHFRPAEGDEVIVLGYKGNDHPERQNTIVMSSVGTGFLGLTTPNGDALLPPMFVQLHGIDSYTISHSNPDNYGNIISREYNRFVGSFSIDNSGSTEELRNEIMDRREYWYGITETANAPLPTLEDFWSVAPVSPTQAKPYLWVKVKHVYTSGDDDYTVEFVRQYEAVEKGDCAYDIVLGNSNVIIPMSKTNGVCKPASGMNTASTTIEGVNGTVQSLRLLFGNTVVATGSSVSIDGISGIASNVSASSVSLTFPPVAISDRKRIELDVEATIKPDGSSVAKTVIKKWTLLFLASGEDGKGAYKYELLPSATSVHINSGGTRNPASLNCVLKKVTSNGEERITTLPDGYSMKYVVQGSRADYTIGSTVTMSGITTLRFELYKAGIDDYIDAQDIIIASDGSNGNSAKYVVVSGEQLFAYSNDFSTAPTQTTIRLTAQLFGGLTGYQWSYKKQGDSSFTAISGATGQSLDVSHSNTAYWGTDNSIRCCTFRCTSGSYHDEITIAKVSSGKNGDSSYTVILSNECHTFAGEDGHAVAGSADCYVQVYKGATPIAATLTINGSSANNTNIATGHTGLTAKITGNGTTSAKATFTAATTLTTLHGKVSIAISADSGNFTTTKDFSFSMSLKGNNGANAKSIYVRGTSWENNKTTDADNNTKTPIYSRLIIDGTEYVPTSPSIMVWQIKRDTLEVVSARGFNTYGYYTSGSSAYQVEAHSPAAFVAHLNAASDNVFIAIASCDCARWNPGMITALQSWGARDFSNELPVSTATRTPVAFFGYKGLAPGCGVVVVSKYGTQPDYSAVPAELSVYVANGAFATSADGVNGNDGKDAIYLKASEQFGTVEVTQNSTYKSRFNFKSYKCVPVYLMKGDTQITSGITWGTMQAVHVAGYSESGGTTYKGVACSSGSSGAYITGTQVPGTEMYVPCTDASFIISATYNGQTYSIELPIKVEFSQQWAQFKADMTGIESVAATASSKADAAISRIKQTAEEISLKVGKLQIGAKNLVPHGKVRGIGWRYGQFRREGVKLEAGHRYVLSVKGCTSTALSNASRYLNVYLFKTKLDGTWVFNRSMPIRETALTVKAMLIEGITESGEYTVMSYAYPQATDDNEKWFYVDYYMLHDVTDLYDNAIVEGSGSSRTIDGKSADEWAAEVTQPFAHNEDDGIGENILGPFASQGAAIITQPDGVSAPIDGMDVFKASMPSGTGTTADYEFQMTKGIDGGESYTLSLWARAAKSIKFADSLDLGTYPSKAYDVPTEKMLLRSSSDTAYIGVADSDNAALSAHTWTAFTCNSLDSKLNQFYFSSYFYNTSNTPCQGYFTDDNREAGNISTPKRSNDGGTYYNVTSRWKRYTITFTAKRNATASLYIRLLAIRLWRTSCPIYFAGVKLERYGDAYEGTTDDKLLDTGIDIKNKKITVTTDTFEIKNNSGELTAWVDKDGWLNSNGLITEGIMLKSAADITKFLIDRNWDAVGGLANLGGNVAISSGDHKDIDIMRCADIIRITADPTRPTGIYFPYFLARNPSDGIVSCRTRTKYSPDIESGEKVHDITTAEFLQALGKTIIIMNPMTGGQNYYRVVVNDQPAVAGYGYTANDGADCNFLSPMTPYISGFGYRQSLIIGSRSLVKLTLTQGWIYGDRQGTWTRPCYYWAVDYLNLAAITDNAVNMFDFFDVEDPV